jgi:hypothetical protein
MVLIQPFTDERERLGNLSQHPARRFERAEICPVQRLDDTAPGDFACPFDVARPAILQAIIGHAIGVGRRDLHEVPIVAALPIDHCRCQIDGTLIVAGEVPPQRDRRPIRRLARDGAFQPFAFVHL